VSLHSGFSSDGKVDNILGTFEAIFILNEKTITGFVVSNPVLAAFREDKK
jgi:hypothetical protein